MLNMKKIGKNMKIAEKDIMWYVRLDLFYDVAQIIFTKIPFSYRLIYILMKNNKKIIF